ncbi:hypothetical protein AB0K60_19570 [Thermopolyspora sp. NPDC052614]|uniref:hypothetical protein n=1 Tax=Thermopolyspora sp. NPDC052614 TaxID=3155682 RepID=UPI0034363D19
MTDTPDTTTPDPDLAHLADLISMIPGPDDPYFWKSLPSESRTDYIFQKLVPQMQLLRKPNPEPVEIASLAKYLIYFFGSTTAKLHDHIGRQTDIAPYELTGRLWVEDLHATCWRLYVRYHARTRTGRWERKWPEDFHAWWAARRESEPAE